MAWFMMLILCAILNEYLWHQKMGHASYKHLSIVSKHVLVLGIPKLSSVSNMLCGPCQLGKQTKAKHLGTQTSATSRPLELLHLDLMGPTRTESLGRKIHHGCGRRLL